MGTTQELTANLRAIISGNVKHSIMIWGAPGIGKSSIVAQVAAEAEMEVIDLRLSQLAPTDLRGLPVAEDGISRWLPPEFLPRAGRGILFLDELNLAPPAMQGMAQQLILDRRVGSYVVPDDWFVWAAGNRKEDRAAVFDMPAPLANRFLHFSVEASLDEFTAYAIQSFIDNSILAFLSFRPELLHKIDPQQPAWPSPRSWMMADTLLKSGVASISAAIGDAVATEYLNFLRLQEQLPVVPDILAGNWEEIPFPHDVSVRYALLHALISRAVSDKERGQVFAWLAVKATPEWLQTFLVECQKRKLIFDAPNDERLRDPLMTALELSRA